MKKSESVVVRMYHTLIDDYARPCLERRGFRTRNGECFRLREGDCEYDVTLDLMKDRIAEQGIVQVGIGVGFRSIWALLSKWERMRDRSIFSAAGVGGPLQAAMPLRERSTKWDWLEPTTDVAALGAELSMHLERYGLPFLERYSDLNHAMKYWGSEDEHDQDVYPLAASYWLRGERDRAYDVIRRMQEDLVAENEPGDYRTEQEVQEIDEFRHFLESEGK